MYAYSFSSTALTAGVLLLSRPNAAKLDTVVEIGMSFFSDEFESLSKSGPVHRLSVHNVCSVLTEMKFERCSSYFKLLLNFVSDNEMKKEFNSPCSPLLKVEVFIIEEMFPDTFPPLIIDVPLLLIWL